MAAQVRPAVRRDLRALGRTLAHAFHDDPVMWHMLGPATTKRLPRMFSVVALAEYLSYRTSDVLTERNRTIGAALWAPPSAKLSQFRQVAGGLGYLWAIGVEQLPVASELMRTVRPHRPSEPHWYLSIIGTEPDVQGSGAGSALMRTGLARCDQSGQPAYLESSKPDNVGFYERFGFTVTEEFPVADGGPVVSGMLRPAR